MPNADGSLTEAEVAAAAASPANNYHGSDVDASNESNHMDLILPSVTDGDEKSYTFFRHKQVAYFEIPRAPRAGVAGVISTEHNSFRFIQGIARIKNSDVPEFLEACAGLHRSDSGNIVQVRNIQNEVPINVGKGIRGPATTATLAAHPTRVATAEDAAIKEPGPQRAQGSFAQRLAGNHRVTSTSELKN